MIFVSSVVSHSISGLVAFVWLAKDALVIDSTQCHLLRKIMRGKAAFRDADGRVIRAMSNPQVLQYWRVLPNLFEIRLQRLNLYKSRCRHPKAFAQPIAAVFAQLPEWQSQPVFNRQGALNFKSPAMRNPHLKQLIDDFRWLDKSEAGRMFLFSLSWKFLFLFDGQHPERVQQLLEIDL